MKVLYKILGVVFVIMALLFALISMYGWMVFCGIFAVICFVVKPKTKKEKAAEEAAEMEASRKEREKYQYVSFPVAGVTFKNDDGSSRQKILKEICDSEEEGYARAELEAYTYEGEPAIRVLVDSDCIGNIRRSDVSKVTPFLDRPGVDVSVSIEQFEDDGRKIYRADVDIKALKEESAQE